MTDQELLLQQDLLQEDAKQLLEQMELMSLLSEIGTPEIAGSFSMGLMTWPDIDITVTAREQDLDAYWHLARKLVELPQAFMTTLTDNVTNRFGSRPTGFYIGMQVDDQKQQRWKIDVWIVKQLRPDLWNAERIKDITQSQRIAILRIKNDFWQHPRYRKDFASVDIYKAAMSGHASNSQEFEIYLKQTGKLS